MATKETVYQGDPKLPPPGAKRDEELARRKDNLAEIAEEMGKNVESINPKALEEDPEIQYLLNQDQLRVKDAQPGYKYRWVQDQYPSTAKGLEVRKAMNTQVSINGTRHATWEIVLHDMPEAKDLKQVDGTRRIGDCILMRCKLDIYMLLQKHEREKRKRRSDGVTAVLEELGESARRHGGKVSVNTGDFDRMQAQEIAAKKFDGMLRDGNIPGMTIRK